MTQRNKDMQVKANNERDTKREAVQENILKKFDEIKGFTFSKGKIELEKALKEATSRYPGACTETMHGGKILLFEFIKKFGREADNYLCSAEGWTEIAKLFGCDKADDTYKSTAQNKYHRTLYGMAARNNASRTVEMLLNQQEGVAEYLAFKQLKENQH